MVSSAQELSSAAVASQVADASRVSSSASRASTGFDSTRKTFLFQHDPNDQAAIYQRLDFDFTWNRRPHGNITVGAGNDDFATVYPNMFVVGWLNLAFQGGNCWKVDVDLKGMIHGAKTKRSVRSFEDIASGTVDFTGSAGYPQAVVKAEVAEPRIAVVSEYLTTTTPDTTVVGTNQTPPGAPSTPPFIWGFLNDPIWVYPSGWVLSNREFDEVGNAVDGYVYAVRDLFTYYQIAKLSG